MIENRKWFKGSRDRGLITFKFIYISTHNEENLKNTYHFEGFFEDYFILIMNKSFPQ